MARMTKPPKNTTGIAWNRWVNQKNRVRGEGRNELGVCRCGHGRYAHDWADDMGERDEWVACGLCDCSLYEYAAPAGNHDLEYEPVGYAGPFPLGARVEWVGPGKDSRRDGETFGVVELQNIAKDPLGYKGYYVRWDSGNLSYSVAHCDLRLVDE